MSLFTGVLPGLAFISNAGNNQDVAIIFGAVLVICFAVVRHARSREVIQRSQAGPGKLFP